MKNNPLKHGVLIAKPADLGALTRKMARERAVELAAISGRCALEVQQCDWEQAKREMMGESGLKKARIQTNAWV